MSSETQPSIGRRIFWVIRTTLLWLIIMVILLGLGYLGYLGVVEAQRSLNSVVTRVEANSRAITELANEVDAVEADNTMQQDDMRAMGRDVEGLDSRLGTLEGSTVAADLAEQLTRQGEMLNGLQAQLDVANSSDETALGDIASLSDAVTALQADLNANSGQIDALGGDIDRLDNEVTELAGQTTETTSTVAELQTAVFEDSQGEELREVLALFRVWELITRARLRLAENNVGLAQGDVETAVRTVDRLIGEDEEAATAYATVQGRLALAFANLPGDPTTASADLETAWDELDAILAAKILPQAPTLEVATPTAEPEPTPTPTP